MKVLGEAARESLKPFGGKLPTYAAILCAQPQCFPALTLAAWQLRRVDIRSQRISSFGLHLLDRMADRHFSEIDLRTMLSVATSVRRDVVPGRWIVNSRLWRRRWEIIVEPDHGARKVVVVTAYPVTL